jgi:hypothetical protein
MLSKSLFSLIVATGMLVGSLGIFPEAQARGWYDNHGRYHYDNGNHYGWYKHSQANRYYDRRRGGWVDYRTGKILKGGLVGAGIGAGAGLLLDRNVGKSALAGAGIGAGTQAIRYRSYMHRHPIVKTAAYGALAGTGVSALSRRTSLGKGALWGAGIGAGLGALNHMD